MGRFCETPSLKSASDTEALQTNHASIVIRCRPYRNNVADEIAQTPLRVCRRARLAADEYRFDYLLSQMATPFHDRVETLGARPFGTISEHSRRVCVAKRRGASRSTIFRQAIKRVRCLRPRTVEYALKFAKRLGIGSPFGRLAAGQLRRLCELGHTHANESKIIEVARLQTPESE